MNPRCCGFGEIGITFTFKSDVGVKWKLSGSRKGRAIVSSGTRRRGIILVNFSQIITGLAEASGPSE